jgi:hypothetical protein
VSDLAECIIPNGEDKNFLNKVNTRLNTNPHLVVAQVAAVFVTGVHTPSQRRIK